jgi:hypothetical protein
MDSPDNISLVRARAPQSTYEDLSEGSELGCVSFLESFRTSLSASPIRSLLLSFQPRVKDSIYESASALDPNLANIDSLPSERAAIGHIMSSTTHRVSFFDEAIRKIKDISPSRLRSRSGSLNVGHAQAAPPPSSTRSRSHSLHLITGSAPVQPSQNSFSSFSTSSTPTLTSDSSQVQSTSIANSDSLAFGKSASEYLEGSAVAQPVGRLDSYEQLRSRQESEMIKAGKRPQLPDVSEKLSVSKLVTISIDCRSRTIVKTGNTLLITRKTKAQYT